MTSGVSSSLLSPQPHQRVAGRYSSTRIPAGGPAVTYFLVAVAAHVRADDTRHLPTPLVIEVVATAALALRVATL